MNAKVILVPTDFSPSSEAALRYAALLARDLEATLLIIHVHPVPELPGAYGDEFDPEEEKERHLLESVHPREAHVPFGHLFVVGYPPDLILRVAREKHANIIVMGAHGQTNSPTNVVGSVASAVLRQATCPVLAIHLPVDAHLAKAEGV